MNILRHKLAKINNKWFLVNIAVMMWAIIADKIFNPAGGLIVRSIHHLVEFVLPADILGMPSFTIVLIIFSTLYAWFIYSVIFIE